MTRLLAALGALLLALPAGAETYGPFESSAGPIQVERMAGPFRHPWAIAFLPDGGYLVTERPGRLRLVRDGVVSAPIEGVPAVRARGQGGLLDVAVDPDFARTARIFLTYSAPAGDGLSQTALARATLADGARLEDFEVIFRQEPAFGTQRHYGSRIVFDRAGLIYLTLGDRAQRPLAQKLDNHIGKVLRLNRDGAAPADNPFVGRADAKPEIWSYGHRNPQGAVIRASDGAYFTISHGARGGDEVNRPEAGRNYGWPEISYGTHYSGRDFPGVAAAGMEQPLHFWDPSIAPSGAAIYEGELFPAWKGDLFVGALKFALISRLSLAGGDAREEERLLQGKFGRVRDVRVGPDGAIWFVTDSPSGAVYRITPAK